MSKLETSFRALKHKSAVSQITKLSSALSSSLVQNLVTKQDLAAKNARIANYFNVRNKPVTAIKDDAAFAIKVLNKFQYDYFPTLTANEPVETGSTEGSEIIGKLMSTAFVNPITNKLNHYDSVFKHFTKKGLAMPDLSGNWASDHFSSLTANISINVFKGYSDEPVRYKDFAVWYNDSMKSLLDVSLKDPTSFSLGFICVDTELSVEAKKLLQRTGTATVLVQYKDLEDGGVELVEVIPSDIVIAQNLPKELIAKISVDHMIN